MSDVQSTDMAATRAMPLAWVEPHRFLLRQPEPGALLFKIVRVRYLIDMLQQGYLHFQRVDTYGDDTADGEQLPLDRTTGAGMSFTKDPQFTAERYYDTARGRTYACCFSLEHSAYLWENYAPDRDAVCLVFDFENLRQLLNATHQATLDNDGLLVQGANTFRQIFSINYGIVDYVDRQTHALHPTRIANPIQFTYLKEKARYANEKELRVSLSALGIGQFALASGAIMEFPPALQMAFDFRDAFAAGVIKEIRCPPQFVDASHLEALRRAMTALGIKTKEDGAPMPGGS
jgi:hypothetical protein